ncbi:MAG: hypothetical protein AB7F86_13305 [Bdellovibrionales bacterium]
MLRAWILVFVLGISNGALASFEYLPGSSGPEKEVKALIQGGNYRQAMMVWPNAMRLSDYDRTETGKAVYAYLMSQNGLPFLSTLLLMQNPSARGLNEELKGLWSQNLKSYPFVQKGYLLTNGFWRSAVNNVEPEIKIKDRKSLLGAWRVASRIPSDQENLKARIWWQIATQSPIVNLPDEGLKAVKLLKESGQTAVGKDQILSAEGRILYQKGDLDAALNAYQQIPKGSELWLESVEERAWIHLRRDDHDKAMAETITLLSPALAPLAGPESFYFNALLSLKTCDYVRLFKNSEDFKKRQRHRLTEMQNLSERGSNSGLNQALARIDEQGLSIEAVGPQLESLPRSALRDHDFKRWMEARHLILQEMKKAESLDKASEAFGASHWLAKIMGIARVQADEYRAKAVKRLRLLAKQELGEYRKILNKMHIAEAEVVHRLAADDNLKGQRPPVDKNAKNGRDVLVFPHTSDEVWLDELDHYQAKVKDCPQLKGASL